METSSIKITKTDRVHPQIDGGYYRRRQPDRYRYRREIKSAGTINIHADFSHYG